MSFFPEREQYTKTWGPFLESAGVTLVLGGFVSLSAYRVWPAGISEILQVFLSPEFLRDPVLLLAVFVLCFFPSLLWLLLHPLVDARRIDRNPRLEQQIKRDYRLLLKEALSMHSIAFIAAVGVGVWLLGPISPSSRMLFTMAVYALVHGCVHSLLNRFHSVFSAQSNLNLQSHLYALLQTNPAQFENTIQLLGAVSAFHHGRGNRAGLILNGRELVSSEELLEGLTSLIHAFPPKEALTNLLKLGAPDALPQFQPIIDQLLMVLRSRTPISAGASNENNVSHSLSLAAQAGPIRILCACLHNFNRSPTMEASLKSLLRQRGLEQTIAVTSGGIAPIPRLNQQLARALKAKGIDIVPGRPQRITEDDLSKAHLVLAADVPTALRLALRLKRHEPSPGAPRKIILFTSLDRQRFGNQDTLPDPNDNSVTVEDSLEQIYGVLEQRLLPMLEGATIPASLIVLAGQLLKGLFPGGLPAYQVERRTRLLLAIARNAPTFLVHIDRRHHKSSKLSPNDLKFLWDDHQSFNEGFLAQLCIRFVERNQILGKSKYAKDYANSLVALTSLLSPVMHQLTKARQQQHP
jgi:protein-tyrosine-phosphatase